jgi:hypothetical protein
MIEQAQLLTMYYTSNLWYTQRYKHNNKTCIFSFGYFPGVRLSFADVSEPSVRSIFKGLMKNILHQAKLNLSPGEYPKENIQDYSEHGENFKSRIMMKIIVHYTSMSFLKIKRKTTKIHRNHWACYSSFRAQL